MSTLGDKTLVHRGKRDYPYQCYLRLSLRHGFSRNPEGFAVPVYMGHDLCQNALDGNIRWTSIECQICGRSVEGEEADREMKRMHRELIDNLLKVRRSLPAEFVLKVLPDMDRDKAYFNKRVAAKMAEGRKKKQAKSA